MNRKFIIANLNKALEGDREVALKIISSIKPGTGKGWLIKIATCEKLSIEIRSRAMNFLEVEDVVGHCSTNTSRYNLYRSLKGA